MISIFSDPDEPPFTPKRDAIVAIMERRWKWMHRPLHGMVALLHPAFKSPLLHSDQELCRDRDNYLKTSTNCAEQAAFLGELIKYNDQRGGGFTNSLSLSRESMVKPLFWWESFGYEMPTLQKIALRVLSQVLKTFMFQLLTLKSKILCFLNLDSYTLFYASNRIALRVLVRGIGVPTHLYTRRYAIV